MAKRLTNEEWENVRAAWENDTRGGFDWLVEERGLSVSRQAVSKRAKDHGWKKVGVVELPPNRGPGSKRKPKTIAQLAPELNDSLTPKERIFVAEHALTGNKSEAARRAGFGQNKSNNTGSDVASRPRVALAIKLLEIERMDRFSNEAREVVSHWMAIARADPTELVKVKRKCCAWCWMEDGRPKFTPSEYDDALFAHIRKRKNILEATGEIEDIGEFPSIRGEWRDVNREPDPACPECGGDGIEHVILADTSNLSPEAKLLYDGAEMTKGGLKINMRSRDKALDNLARFMRLLERPVDEEEGGELDIAELDAKYVKVMEEARARQRRVMASRKDWIEGKAEIVEDDESA